jgi:hypothetical protein
LQASVFRKMRNYIRKSNRGVDQADLEEAARLVNDDSKSVRYAANQLSIPRTSLTCKIKERLQGKLTGLKLGVVSVHGKMSRSGKPETVRW